MGEVAALLSDAERRLVQVCKAHGLLYHSTLGLRVKEEEEEERRLVQVEVD